MEHLNRDLKGAIGHLTSNVNKTAIDRIAKSLHKLSIIMANFDKHSEIAGVWLPVYLPSFKGPQMSSR